MLNTFIQYDPDTLRVTAILDSEAEGVPGFIKITKPLPKPDAMLDQILYFDYSKRTCYLEEASFRKERIDIVEEENASLKKDIRDLQDIIMYLMMS